MQENTRVAFSVTLSRYVPFAPVTVPIDVPLTETLTPDTGSSFTSVTVPLTVLCEYSENVLHKAHATIIIARSAFLFKNIFSFIIKILFTFYFLSTF
jgi:hypothetical protein